MPSWPATLPQHVLEQGYSEKLEDQTIETQVDAGIAKIRRRYTSANQLFQVTIQMTNAQAQTFETFYRDTLQGGVLSFDWVHPRYRTAASFRFRRPPPQYQSVGSEYVQASMVLEKLP